MGRTAKHDWKALYNEYEQGEFMSVAAYAKAKGLNVNQVRDEFRKLKDKSPQQEKKEQKTEKKPPVKKAQKKRQTTEKQEKEPARKLTPKEVVFVAEYLTDFNAKRAAMAVGCPPAAAHATGWKWLQKVKIQAEIKRQTAIVVESLGVTPQRVLLEYLKIAFSDVTAFLIFGQREVHAMGAFGPLVDQEGKPIMKTVNFVDFKNSTEIDGTLIHEVRQGKDGVSIKLYDRLKALEKVEKYIDLLPDHFKRRIEEEKLKIDRERLDIEKTKANGNPAAEAESNARLLRLANLINNPEPDRHVEDFEEDEEAEDDDH